CTAASFLVFWQPLSWGGFRTLYFGYTFSSVLAIATLAAATPLILFVGRSRVRRGARWAVSFTIYQILGSIAFIIVLREPSVYMTSLMVYNIGSGLVTFGVYHYLRFILTISDVFVRYQTEAQYDYLTGVYNARTFHAMFNAKAAAAEARNENLTLILVDADHFKDINDQHGHETGDLVLRDLSTILSDSLRSRDVVARYGGEEFAITLGNCGPERAVEVGERIRQMVEAHVFTTAGGQSLRVTVSAGIASFPRTTKEPGDLFRDADIALYEAKRGGRNRCVVHQIHEASS
ncbi:MAG: GGDEF domain-containing protein, partial [Spirochaeta sp.]